MNRNNTSFQSQLYAALEKALETSELSDKLFYYQKLVILYALLGVSRGLYIWHPMGSDKTITSIALSKVLHDMGYKVIIITPKSLQKNYKSGIKTYNEIMEGSLSEDMFNFVVKSNIVNRNVAKVVGLTQMFSEDRTPVKITAVKIKTAFIIDEAHQVSQLIANGSVEWGEFYNIIMRSPLAKVFMLSGSIFSASPFELVPICNMLSGQKLFPEYRDEFFKRFWDPVEQKIKNRGFFQNRIYGLFSRIPPTYLETSTTNFYPEQAELEVIKCPMTKFQLESYLLARVKEIQEKKIGAERGGRPDVKKFDKDSKDTASYRVKTLQYGNFAPPVFIEEIYKKNNYTGDELMLALKDVPSSFLETSKYITCEKLANKHKGKMLVHSRFTGIGGAGSLGEFLKRRGWKEVTASDTKPGEHMSFALVNGSLTIDEQEILINIFNSKGNRDGQLIKFLIIGDQQTTGLDIKEGEATISLSPSWNSFIFDQFNARIPRMGSHKDMPEDRRKTYSYLLVSVYPPDINPKVLLNRDTRITTDEHLYNLMLKDKKMSEEFKVPIAEVAIECQFLKAKHPEYICRVCAPNNKKLFTDDMDTMAAISYDCARGDPCDLSVKEEVKAKKVTIGESEYYAVINKESKHGYNIYYKIGNEYEEILPSSPIYKEIISSLK